MRWRCGDNTTVGWAALGVFVSTLTRIPLAATIATGAVLGVAEAAQSANFLHPVLPILPTTYWDGYSALFHSGQPWNDIAHALLSSMLYLLVFATGAWVTFSRADIAT